MKHKMFSGIAVHPECTDRKHPGIVGITLLGRRITPGERAQLKALNNDKSHGVGHVGIRTSERGTSILLTGRFTPVEARKAVLKLRNAVRGVTGSITIVRQLSTHRAVSRALAV